MTHPLREVDVFTESNREGDRHNWFYTYKALTHAYKKKIIYHLSNELTYGKEILPQHLLSVVILPAMAKSRQRLPPSPQASTLLVLPFACLITRGAARIPSEGSCLFYDLFCTILMAVL